MKAFRTSPICDEILAERDSQDAKWGWPNVYNYARHLAGDNVDGKLSILVEEVGEVARAILEHDDANLRVELIQCAAVCAAWVQSINEFGR